MSVFPLCGRQAPKFGGAKVQPKKERGAAECRNWAELTAGEGGWERRTERQARGAGPKREGGRGVAVAAELTL